MPEVASDDRIERTPASADCSAATEASSSPASVASSASSTDDRASRDVRGEVVVLAVGQVARGAEAVDVRSQVVELSEDRADLAVGRGRPAKS